MPNKPKEVSPKVKGIAIPAAPTEEGPDNLEISP